MNNSCYSRLCLDQKSRQPIGKQSHIFLQKHHISTIWKKAINFFLFVIAGSKVDHTMESPDNAELPRKRKESLEFEVDEKKQKRDNTDFVMVRKTHLWNWNIRFSKQIYYLYYSGKFHWQIKSSLLKTNLYLGADLHLLLHKLVLIGSGAKWSTERGHEKRPEVWLSNWETFLFERK